MGRLLRTAAVLLLVARALAGRLAEQDSLIVGAEGAAGRSRRPGRKRKWLWSDALPRDIVGSVLKLVPPIPTVAASGGGRSSILSEGQIAAEVRNVTACDGDVVDMTFFPGGDRFVTASDRGMVIVWDTATGQGLHAIRAHEPFRVFEVRVFPAGDRLVTLGRDGLIKIWNATSADLILRIAQRHHLESPHLSVRVFPDGGRLATGVVVWMHDPDLPPPCGAMIWDATTGDALLRIDNANIGAEQYVSSIHLTPCGARLVTVAMYQAYVWDTATGDLLQAAGSTRGLISGVAVSTGAKRLVISSFDGTLVLVDNDARPPERKIRTFSSIDGVAMTTPGGDRFVTFGGKTVTTWDFRSTERMHEISSEHSIYRLVLSRDGAYVAACGIADTGNFPIVSVWDRFNGRTVFKSKLPPTKSWFAWLGRKLLPEVFRACLLAVA